MNRLWVRLWLGIVGAFVGLLISFETAELVVTLAVNVFPTLAANEPAQLAWSNFGGLFLSLLLAALIARHFAEPLSAVSQAAQAVAGGDLNARAHVSDWLWRPLGIRRRDEVTRLAQDFNTMAASLERLEAERRASTAVIAHELRTPLAVLQARLSALRDGVFVLNAHEVNLLAQQTDVLARLVEDLRTLSLAEAGKLKMDVQACDLSALVRDAVESFGPRAEARGVAIEVYTEDATITGDPARLRQVVTNLLDNALKFTPDAETIDVAVRVAGLNANLSVRDRGPGIADELRLRVFERFYQAGAERPGSGLGLAIVRSIVELHGGTADVVNVPGGGALFKTSFPLAR